MSITLTTISSYTAVWRCMFSSCAVLVLPVRVRTRARRGRSAAPWSWTRTASGASCPPPSRRTSPSSKLLNFCDTYVAGFLILSMLLYTCSEVLVSKYVASPRIRPVFAFLPLATDNGSTTSRSPASLFLLSLPWCGRRHVASLLRNITWHGLTRHDMR